MNHNKPLEFIIKSTDKSQIRNFDILSDKASYQSRKVETQDSIGRRVVPDYNIESIVEDIRNCRDRADDLLQNGEETEAFKIIRAQLQEIKKLDLVIKKEPKIRSQYAALYSILSSIYLDQKDFSEGRKVIKKGLKAAKDLEDSRSRIYCATLNSDLISIYVEKGQYKKASILMNEELQRVKELIEEKEDIIKSNDNDKLIAEKELGQILSIKRALLSYLAMICVNQNNYEKGIEYAKMGLDIIIEGYLDTDPYKLCSANLYRILCECYIQQEKWNKANIALNLGLDGIKSVKLYASETEKLRAEFNQLSIKIQEAQNQYVIMLGYDILDLLEEEK